MSVPSSLNCSQVVSHTMDQNSVVGIYIAGFAEALCLFVTYRPPGPLLTGEDSFPDGMHMVPHQSRIKAERVRIYLGMHDWHEKCHILHYVWHY